MNHINTYLILYISILRYTKKSISSCDHIYKYTQMQAYMPSSRCVLSSHQFSLSVTANSLETHGLQHTRPPCPSPTPRVYSNSHPLSWWCHPAISSSVIPFSSCLQSFQQQGLFQWVSSSNQVAKVLEFQLQHQSFQWIFRTDFL